MADDPRAALSSLERQLRELAEELGGRPAPAPPEPAAPVTAVAPPPPAPVAPPPAPVAPPPAPVARPELLTAADRVAAAVVPHDLDHAPPLTGTVELHAGPFDAADPVLALRDAVAALPQVRDARLRRVEARTAVIEVELR